MHNSIMVISLTASIQMHVDLHYTIYFSAGHDLIINIYCLRLLSTFNLSLFC